MSFLEENAGVKMDSGDLERAEPQCGPEDAASGPLESGPSLASLNSAHAGPKVVTQVPEKFTIHDQVHKVLVLNSGTLLAVPHKDPTYAQKQNLGQLTTWQEEDSKPFAFYRADVGSRNTLESAAYPGWFICTSNNWGEPVGMTNNPGQKEYIDFSFEPVKNVEMSPSEISK
ncbi:interleukin 37 [Phyllostomus discolor]|uniref:Interleukin-1 n=1 Tax=Phyllostomus discolor TaxID=89673 RepID=A0A834A6I5_9CHIR|nr:interleukin 37 [Phyllostomus discolor]